MNERQIKREIKKHEKTVKKLKMRREFLENAKDLQP